MAHVGLFVCLFALFVCKLAACASGGSGAVEAGGPVQFNTLHASYSDPAGAGDVAPDNGYHLFASPVLSSYIYNMS